MKISTSRIIGLIKEVVTKPISNIETSTITCHYPFIAEKEYTLVCINNVPFNLVSSKITISSFKQNSFYIQEIPDKDEVNRGYGSEG